MQPLTRALHKKWWCECTQYSRMLCRYPNPFESTTFKNQFKGEFRWWRWSFTMCEALSRVCSLGRKYLSMTHHGRCVMVWVQITVTQNHESEALPWSRIVRAVLELPWLEVTVVCKFVTVVWTPPWPWFEEPTQKRCQKRHFFRGGSFVVFGGEKGERKEGRKFVEHSAKLILYSASTQL